MQVLLHQLEVARLKVYFELRLEVFRPARVQVADLVGYLRDSLRSMGKVERPGLKLLDIDLGREAGKGETHGSCHLRRSHRRW